MPRGSGISFEELNSGVEPKKLSDWERFEIEFESLHFFQKLQQLPKIRLKKMFGGLAIYRDNYLLLALMEDDKDQIWKGKKYDFPLWYGLLIATDHPHHPHLKKKYPQLINHPVLGKWLYLPRKNKKWVDQTKKICSLILRGTNLVGVRSKIKASKKK